MENEPNGKELATIPLEVIERKIYLIRGQKVMLDSDLATLYEVPTKAFNQAVKRNIDRFPDDFMFRLTSAEAQELNRSQFVTGSQKHRDPRFLPYAFTEHGVAMLSSVLRSERAVQMNIIIVRAFIKLREILATHRDLAEKLEKIEGQQDVQGSHIANLYQLVKRLAGEKRKRRNPIGFVTGKGKGEK